MIVFCLINEVDYMSCFKYEIRSGIVLFVNKMKCFSLIYIFLIFFLKFLKLNNFFVGILILGVFLFCLLNIYIKVLFFFSLVLFFLFCLFDVIFD